jgi:hypothetical protein
MPSSRGSSWPDSSSVTTVSTGLSTTNRGSTTTFGALNGARGAGGSNRLHGATSVFAGRTSEGSDWTRTRDLRRDRPPEHGDGGRRASTRGDGWRVLQGLRRPGPDGYMGCAAGISRNLASTWRRRLHVENGSALPAAVTALREHSLDRTVSCPLRRRNRFVIFVHTDEQLGLEPNGIEIACPSGLVLVVDLINVRRISSGSAPVGLVRRRAASVV